MCGPLTVVFSLSSHPQETSLKWQQQLYFHTLLNLGRILSYALVGAGIGALGSVLIAGGQLAGIASPLRRGIAILTGSLLIWFGLAQIMPARIPQLPFLHPLAQREWHNRLSAAMVKLSVSRHWWTPALLGMVWGLVPCGFLYVAQIKAAETGNLWRGAATMLAFGLGTLPTMLGVGISTSLLSADRRNQLFRTGGWVTLIIGVLTLMRTGNTMVDYTGSAALLSLVLALTARPLSRLWPQPLHYRRALGVGAFVLSVAHTLHMMEHTLDWNFQALSFMLPGYQVGTWTGILALVLMTPLALTSFDQMIHCLGKRWRQLHLLSIPALLLCAVHVVLLDPHFLGELRWSWVNYVWTALFGITVLGVLLIRSRWVWSLLSLDKFYAAPVERK